MYHSFIMTKADAAEQLKKIAPCQGSVQGIRADLLNVPFEVPLKVLEYKVEAVFAVNHPLQLHNVLMPQLAQHTNFSDSDPIDKLSIDQSHWRVGGCKTPLFMSNKLQISQQGQEHES
eukprot:TRINITY_DN10316_c0_g1_i4.p2 TRINITY_DN10316_c0_g1~~TRINITY_DN10316_c0_g1_i4.p2  ORF type:complete len:118 (-),score=15.06 TRINITY_DN10316_c0_g1_i4:396-749(-)